MSQQRRLAFRCIISEEERETALRVLASVYKGEKGWVKDPAQVLPVSDLTNPDVIWVGAFEDQSIVGVVRVLFAIPFNLYHEYGFQLTVEGLDVEAFIRENKIAEVGRFAVLPEYRKVFAVALGLMKQVGDECEARQFTHLITDVFEDDVHTPRGFHSRILGFQEVATHDVGEIDCSSRRITMMLDIRQAKARFQQKKGWAYRYLRDSPTETPNSVAS